MASPRDSESTSVPRLRFTAWHHPPLVGILVLCSIPRFAAPIVQAVTTEGEHLLYGFDAICKQSFAEQYWSSRTTLLKERTDQVGQLFGVGDILELLHAANGTFQVAGGTAVQGHTAAVSPQPLRRKGQLSDYFRNSTIALSAIETQLPRLAAWSRTFARAFGVTSEVNLYLTPPGAQAFSVHNDRQDVLAVQIQGQKSWNVWDLHGLQLPPELGLEPAVAPFRHTVALQKTNTTVPLQSFPSPSLSVQLRPGDLLYVPRGSLHVASTADSSLSSLHLTIGVLTQSFSYAIAIFHLATEPSIRQIISQAGWDMHRFRQSLMRLADQKVDGAEFRETLPLGWLRGVPGRATRPVCPEDKELNSNRSMLVLNKVKSTLEALVERVLREAPKRADSEETLPSQETTRGQITVSDEMLLSVADVFIRHLHKFDEDLASTANLTRRPHADAIELPAGLHVSFIAWDGDDDPSSGKLEARFSWCRHGGSGAAEAQLPITLLPMIQVISASTSRVVPFASLNDGEDIVPKMMFALELAQLPLNPAIKLVVASSVVGPTARQPDCGTAEDAEL